MPCVYDDYGESDRKREAEMNRVTDLLCSVCGQMEKWKDDNDYFVTVPGLHRWWEEHKAKDKVRLEREAKEKLRQETLASLTKAQREALGV